MRAARWPAPSRWLAAGALAFAFHLLWEMAQMRAYRDMEGQHWSTAGRCARAAVGDAGLTLLIIGSSLADRRDPSARGWLIVALVGAVVGVAIERYALQGGLWRYNQEMPRLPGLDVGVWPVLQMALLPTFTLWLGRAVPPKRTGP